MSELTLYSYSAERCTDATRATPAERLASGYTTLHDGDEYGFPFSGDMLTVLAKGTAADRRERRDKARAGLRGKR